MVECLKKYNHTLRVAHNSQDYKNSKSDKKPVINGI